MDDHALNVEALLAEQSWLRALARRLTQDDASADDLVQETWIAALRRPPETGRPLRPWLAQVLANFARMRVRREGGLARRERSAARSEVMPDTSQLVERAEVQRRLARFVLELDEPFRATVLLRYYEGLSSAEIARQSGVPAGTVRWRLKEGLERLREHLDREHGGERSAWCALLAPLAGERALPPMSLAGLPLPTLLIGGAGLLLLAGLATQVWPLLRTPDGDEARPTSATLPSESTGAGTEDVRLGELAVRDARQSVATPPTPRTASDPLALELEARAVDAAGQPLEGASLFLAGAAEAVAVSAADGRLRISTEAPPLAFEAPFTLVLTHPACAARERRTSLAPEQLNQLGDLALEPGGAVRGRVVDGSGKALAGTRVRLEALPTRWQSGLGPEPLGDARIFDSMLGEDVPATTTDPDGRYSFGGLAVGHVRLWAQQPGLLGAYSEPVAVRAGATAECANLVLVVPGDDQCIAGRIVDASGDHVADAEIEISRASTQSVFFTGEPWVVRVRAGHDGRFRAVVGAFPNYDLAARDPSGALAPVVLRRLKAGSRDIVVRLAPPQPIALEVRDSHGDALPGADVHLIDARAGRMLDTGAVLAVPWVPFKVSVSHAGCQPAVLGPFEPARAPSELTVRLEAARQLTGRVRAAGAPLAGTRLELWPALPAGRHAVHGDVTPDGAGLCAFTEHGPVLATAVSDAEGRFTFDVIRAGRCFVRAEAQGFAPLLLGPLELSIERTPDALELELATGGAIEGRVLGADNAPVVGRTIAATNGDGYAKGARTDAEGRYRIEGLAAGAWQVRELAQDLAARGWGRIASTPTWLGSSEPAFDCSVVDGATTTYDLLLGAPRSALLSGRLLLGGTPPGAWLVLLARPGEEPGQGLDTGLDAEGRFELRVPAPGRYHLSLWTTGHLPLPMTVHDTLELTAGPNTWELDLPTAELTLEGMPAWKENEPLYHLFEGPGELWCATLLVPDPDGTRRLPQAPAGKSRIVSSKGAYGASDPRQGRTVQRLVITPNTPQRVRLR